MTFKYQIKTWDHAGACWSWSYEYATERCQKFLIYVAPFIHIKWSVIYMVGIDLYKIMDFELIVTMQEWYVSVIIKTFRKILAQCWATVWKAI